jgi:hypothetical protein
VVSSIQHFNGTTYLHWVHSLNLRRETSVLLEGVHIHPHTPDEWVSLCRSNTQLHRQQANVIQDQENANVRDIGQGEAQH